MAGINPGMIIKVAADIRDAIEALGTVVKAEGTLEESTGELNKAYGALDVAVGTFAANAATALFGLAFDAVKGLSKELWGVVDAAVDVTKQFDAFEKAISGALKESGVLQAGIDALGRSLLAAFGGTQQELVHTVARLIEDGALHALDFTKALIDLGVLGARGIAALIVPVDALFFAIGYVGERLVTFELSLIELAQKVPGIGSSFDGLAIKAHAMADTMQGWRDNTYNTTMAHQDLVSGGGPLVAMAESAKTAIDAAKAAMLDQRLAADAAATGVHGLTDANAGLVLGNGEAVVALYNQNKALEDMDKWSRAIKNTDPYAYLKMGMEKTLPPLEATTKAMKDTAKEAIDMSADVKFAAEVVQKATLSWSEAMDAVRKGQGTMTGQIGAPVRPPGISDSEWNLRLTDPHAWEAQHGYDWASTNAGTTAAWSMGGAASTGTVNTQTNNITVNTVAGDKQAIAAVVKDSIASDWKSSGVRA